MDATPEQALMLRYVMNEFIRRRQLSGQPIPTPVFRLLADVSACGTEPDDDPEESQIDDLIDTTEAAQILHCSTRRIRRIAADLDGEQVAGRWIFRRATVTKYADLKQGAA